MFHNFSFSDVLKSNSIRKTSLSYIAKLLYPSDLNFIEMEDDKSNILINNLIYLGFFKRNFESSHKISDGHVLEMTCWARRPTTSHSMRCEQVSLVTVGKFALMILKRRKPSFRFPANSSQTIR